MKLALGQHIPLTPCLYSLTSKEDHGSRKARVKLVWLERVETPSLREVLTKGILIASLGVQMGLTQKFVNFPLY